ncbi:MAG: hypothetical protein ACP5K1_07060, partial [Candidatus Bathyarchaeia archaeon]
IQYSSPYDIRISLWDLDLGRPIDEITDKLGPYMGVKTYKFTLTAPKEAVIWRLSVEVGYILPYYIDQSSTYKHTEPGWYYDFEIYVGAETETKTMTTKTSYSYEETETETLTPTRVEASITGATTSLATTTSLMIGGERNISAYAPYIIGGAVVAAVAIAFLALKKYKILHAPPKVKHCISCGVELPLEAEYCHECGAEQPREVK